MRLDKHVCALFPALSRASVQKLIDEGRVAVNGIAQTKAGYAVKTGDKVRIDYDPDNLPAIPTIDLPILYEDDACVVIDKPVGLLSHSKGAFNPEATVATWLSRYHKNPLLRRSDLTKPYHKNPLLRRSDLTKPDLTKPDLTKPDLTKLTKPDLTKLIKNERVGIVHRLDRATSGVMVCAKTPEALSWLQKQFSLRKVKKSYIAVIAGELDPVEAIIDMPIERNPASPQRFRVGPNGKASTTHYKTMRTFEQNDVTYSLLELKPDTGRTHQLRVHLAHQKHPILGDTFYDGQPAERLYLHAASLEITLPHKTRRVFTTSLPKDFAKPRIIAS